MFRLEAIPAIAAADRVLMAGVNKVEVPIKFSAGNPENVELDRQLPLEGVWLRLSGTYTSTNGAKAINHGAVDIIKSIALTLDTDSTIWKVPGWYLPTWHRRAMGQAVQGDDVAADDTDQDFDLSYFIPIDAGAYLSLLDASANRVLSLDIEWGSAADIAVDKTTAGLEAVSGVQVDVTTEAPSGAMPGKLGGVRYPYWRGIRTYRKVPITQTDSDMVYKLGKNRDYSSLVFVAFTGSTAAESDAVLNKATLRIGRTNLRTMTDVEMKRAQSVAYKLSSSDFTGVYELPIARPNHPEELLNVNGTQDFAVHLDVTAGTNTSLYVFEEYFLRPNQAA